MKLIIPFKIGVILTSIYSQPAKNISTNFINAFVTNEYPDKFGYLGKNTAPQAFSDKTFVFSPGVHLHFILPDALTSGISQDGKLSFPNVPNRWLVTREYTNSQNKKQIKNFVVESNFFSLDQEKYGGSVTIPAFGDRTYGENDDGDMMSYAWRYLGRNYELEKMNENENLHYAENIESICENTPTGYLKNLSALGPGDPMFAAYYPNCQTVFGFYDPASDILENSRVSYCVTGFYSDNTLNPLYGLTPDEVKQKMDFMKLTIPGNTETDFFDIMTFGSVTDIIWMGNKYNYDNRFKTITANISIGLTAEEALSAVVANVIFNDGISERERFLTELQYDLGDYAKQPDGNFSIEDEIHKRQFDVLSALGTYKQIEILKEIKNISELGNIPSVYAEMTKLYKEIGTLSRTLDFKRDALYKMFEQYMDAFEVHHELNYKMPTEEKSKQILEGICEEIDALEDRIKSVDEQIRAKLYEIENSDSYKQKIIGFTDVSEEPFYSPKSPTIMLSGKEIKRIFAFGENGNDRADGKVLCIAGKFRFKSEKADVLEDNILPNLPEIKLPRGLDFSDYKNLLCAGGIFNKNIDGYNISDDYSKLFHSAPFENPILFIDWEAALFLINQTREKLIDDIIFEYNDTNYKLKENTSYKARETFRSRMPITPHTLINFAERMGNKLKDNENKAERIEEIERHIKSLSFLSQNLNGFTEHFLGRLLTVQFPIDLEDNNHLYEKIALRVKSERPAISRWLDFMPIRTGFFRISRLELTDSFGISSPDFSVDSNNSAVTETFSETILTTKINDVIHGELPPVFTAPARLSADFVCAKNHLVYENVFENTTSVIAVLVPDILNNHLKIFVESEYIGDLKVVYREKLPECRFISADGTSTVASGNETVDSFIKSFSENSDKSAFAELIDLIDLVLCKKVRSSSLIWGRPLVLATMAVKFEFFGDPEFSVHQGTFGEYETLGAENVRIPLYFGDINRVTDGVIGVYNDRDFSSIKPLWGVSIKHQNSKFISNEPIRISHSDKTKYVTVLAEANSDIYISTGFLPVKKVRPKSEINIDLSYSSEINPVIGSLDELSLPLLEDGKTYSFKYRNMQNEYVNINTNSNLSAYQSDNIIIDGVFVSGNK
jgi:hypothetical protein